MTAYLVQPQKYTVHIEGNNCTLRHLISRATRKSCCFSKILNNHIKAFDLGIYYLNYRHIEAAHFLKHHQNHAKSSLKTLNKYTKKAA